MTTTAAMTATIPSTVTSEASRPNTDDNPTLDLAHEILDVAREANRLQREGGTPAERQALIERRARVLARMVEEEER